MQTSLTKILSLIVGIVFLFVVVSSSVNAEPLRAVGLKRFQGHFGLGIDYDDDSRDNIRGGGKIGGRDTTWFEELGMDMVGYMYHPRLFQFQVKSELRFEQQSVKPEGGSSLQQDGLFTSYSVYSSILKEHDISLQLDASRQNTDMQQDFFGRRRIIYSKEKALLSYQNEIVPAILSYSTSRSMGEGSDPTDDNTETLNLELRNWGKLGESRLIVEKEDKSQSAQNRDLQINVADFFNAYRFGKGERNNFSSRFRFFDQEGTDEFRHLNAGQSLFFNFSDSLQSRSTVDYFETKSQDQVISNLNGSSRIQHRLYDSLTSTLQAIGRRSKIGGGVEKSIGGQATCAYAKLLPFGRISLTYQASAKDVAEKFTEKSVFILREQHFFGENPEGDEVIILERDFADPLSIEISDENGLAIIDPETGFSLTEGVHYLVDTTGSVTRIRLLPAGFFLTGDGEEPTATFVSYNFQPGSDLEYTTIGQSLSTSISLWRNWRFYYSISKTQQNLQKGIDIGKLEDSDSKSFGFELNWLRTTSRFKKERVNSPKTPLEKFTVSESFSIPLGFSPFFRPIFYIGASYSEAETFPHIDKTYGRDIRVALTLKKYRLQWYLEAKYTNDDLIVEDQNTFEFRANLGWKLRAFNISFSYEYLLRERELSGDDENSTLIIELKRKFRLL